MWLTLNAAGEPQHMALLPEDVQVRLCSAGRYWGLLSDEFGVGSIVRFATTR
jgi:hypothetical protein